MSDERSRRFQRVSSESATIGSVLGVIAVVLLLFAAGSYAGTSADGPTPAWVVMLAFGGLFLTPFSAAFGAVSYLTGVLAETERMS